MGIIRAASISYGGFSTGGVYQLNGPYAINRDFGSFMCSWEIVVVADANFQSACEALEVALNKRDQELVISWPGGSWTYTPGENALNTTCAVTKSGDREADTGHSRAYNVEFTCLLPALDESGMFQINSSVAYDPARVRTIMMQGEVRGQSGTDAWTQYQNIISTWDTDIQAVVDDTAVWELQAEDVAFDRNNHVVNFSRTFAELIDQDAPGQDDNPEIVQQRVTYTRVSAFPGDADPDVNRPERFIVEYSCFVDKELKLGLDQLSSLYEDTIFPWIKQRFVDEWGPQAFAVTEHQRQFLPSVNQINSRLSIMAYMQGGDLVESTRSETYRDERTIDYTPVWNEDELAAYADQGFMVRLRETVSSETRLGEQEARSPITPNTVAPSGWNVIAASEEASPIYIGEPPDQVRLTTLVKRTLERFTKSPGEGGTVPAEPSDRTGRFDPGGRTEEEIQRQVTEQTSPEIRRPGFIPGSSPQR